MKLWPQLLCLLLKVSAQDVTGADLVIDWCDSTAPLQRFSLPNSDGTIKLLQNMSACVSSVQFGTGALRTLTMAPCGSQGSGLYTQHFTYQSTSYIIVDANGYAWNDQWDSSAQGVGGFTRQWPASELSFNSYFTYLPATQQFSVNFTQPGNNTPTDLCVTVVPPPPPSPPPLPTSAQAAWQQGGEVGCFVHYNMATMVSSQGCGGGAPPPISAWQPTAVDTDAWVDACA